MKTKRRRPRLTKAVIDGLGTVVGLAQEDIFADQRRDWGNAHKAIEYLNRLIAWHGSNNELSNSDPAKTS